MMNQTHIICQTESLNISVVVRDFKKFMATSILNQIKNDPESRADWMLKRFESGSVPLHPYEPCASSWLIL